MSLCEMCIRINCGKMKTTGLENKGCILIHLNINTITFINHHTLKSIEAYTASRLVPLEKEPAGIRPIGIGEVLRRIVGITIVAEKPEIMESSGSLQLCGGQKAGCEVAAHAMTEIYDSEETDAVLFIDASKAFNSLNREALLHNIKSLCPPMAIYLNNCELL